MRFPCLSLAMLGIGLFGVAAGLSLDLWYYGEQGWVHRLADQLSGGVREYLVAGCVWGTPLAVLGMPGACRLFRKPLRSWPGTLTRVGAGALCTAEIIISVLPFFWESEGSIIRPMMPATASAIATVVGLITAIYFSLEAEGAPRWLRWLGLVLCLMPYPLDQLLWKLAQSMTGFVLNY